MGREKQGALDNHGGVSLHDAIGLVGDGPGTVPYGPGYPFFFLVIPVCVQSFVDR